MFGLEELGLLGLFIGAFLAATVLPLSTDVLYIAVLLATGDPVGCLIFGSLGNWLGGITTFLIGWFAKWEWIEKWFKVKPETLEKQKKYVDRYGVWVALLSWVPFFGDVTTMALGFYKAHPVWTILLLLVGKFGRFAVWTLLFAPSVH